VLQAVLSAIKMRQARTAAVAAPAITGAVRVGSAGSSSLGDSVQFVFVGATTSKAVAAARTRYAPDCIVTQPVGASIIAVGGSSDDAAPVVNPLLKHNFVTVDGNGDKLQVSVRFFHLNNLDLKLLRNTPAADHYTHSMI
jgi:hypothetical protein